MSGPVAIVCFAGICFGVSAVLLMVRRWTLELGEIAQTLIIGMAAIVLMTAALFASTPFILDAMAYYGLIAAPDAPVQECAGKLVQCYEFVGKAVKDGRLQP